MVFLEKNDILKKYELHIFDVGQFKVNNKNIFLLLVGITFQKLLKV